MIMVIGGIASGKKAFVTQTLGYAASDISYAEICDKPVVFELHLMVQKSSDDVDVDTLVCQLAAKEVVVCNEVGSGIVPMDEQERTWRERVGRMCTSLAKEARVVVRMQCGIPVFLKGSL